MQPTRRSSHSPLHIPPPPPEEISKSASHALPHTIPRVETAARHSFSSLPPLNRSSSIPISRDHKVDNPPPLENLADLINTPPTSPTSPSSTPSTTPPDPSPLRAENLKSTIKEESTYIKEMFKKHQLQLTKVKTMKIWNKVLVGIGITAALTAMAVTIAFFPPLVLFTFGVGVVLTTGLASYGDKLISEKPDMSRGDVGRAEKRLETLNKALHYFENYPKNASTQEGGSFEEFLEKNAHPEKDEHTGLDTYSYSEMEPCVTIFGNTRILIPQKEEEIDTLQDALNKLKSDPATNDKDLKSIKESLEKAEIAFNILKAEVRDAVMFLKGYPPPSSTLEALSKHAWSESANIETIPSIQFHLSSPQEAICFFGNEANVPNIYGKLGDMSEKNRQILDERGCNSSYDFLSINALGTRPIIIDGKGYRTITHYLLHRKIEKHNQGLTRRDEKFVDPNHLEEVSKEVSTASTGREAIKIYLDLMPKFNSDEIFKGQDDDLKKALFHKYINPDGTISENGYALLATGDVLLLAGYEPGDRSYGVKCSLSGSRLSHATLKGENRLGRYTMDFRDFLRRYQSDAETMMRSAFITEMNRMRREVVESANSAGKICEEAIESTPTIEETIVTAKKWVVAMAKNNDRETGIEWNRRFRAMIEKANNDLKAVAQKYSEASKQIGENEAKIKKMKVEYKEINKTKTLVTTTNILQAAETANHTAQTELEKLKSTLTKQFAALKSLEKEAEKSEKRFAQ